MYSRSILLLLSFICGGWMANAQEPVPQDSLPSKVLHQITVRGFRDRKHPLPDVSGVNIFAGKKTESTRLNQGNANLAQNVGRMIFAKMPGVNIWDMDGAGTQMNVGTRGTDAHRSIEMNMRQNGYNTNSDMVGYPENHYSVPMQGVDQIQLVRGSAALQFGSQFGGMMNYVMKEGDSARVFSLESEQTMGSYNFFNSYNAIGGTKGKVKYYAYYDNRHGDGWRPNSNFNYQAYYASIKYQFSSHGRLSFEFSRMDYRQQIAGGLTDGQFAENAQQSDRARNYFSPKINIPAVVFNYDFSPEMHLEVMTNVIWGERSSVQFINPPNVKDTFNTALGSYNPRQVDRDFYNGFTTEARLLRHYKIWGMNAAWVAGFRYFDERTKRQQKGTGTTGSNFDFSLTSPYGTDLKFHTVNYAAFVENVFWLNEELSITPGFRYEIIDSELSGVMDDDSFAVAYKGKRSFPLFGMGLQYQLNSFSQLYGNISQAYRPYLYANFTPANQIGVIDPDLKDSKGYDVDLGYRGQIQEIINFDINAFYLFYGDRIGKITETDNTNTSYLLTTNIGNSVAKGVEAFVDFSLLKLLAGTNRNADVRVFNSLAYTHARYIQGAISSGNDNVSLTGNRVEGVPDWIERAGLEFRYGGLSTTFQVNYVSHQFNDATNTRFDPTGVVGIIPAYTLFDWAINLTFMNQYNLSAGVNNIADARYFSRRITMYPGPGILPADGRTAYISLGLKI